MPLDLISKALTALGRDVCNLSLTLHLLNNPMIDEKPKKKSTRGFVSMSPEKQREIARKGGQSVPAGKRSFSQNAELAVAAGRKGGQSVDPAKRSFSRDPQLASKAGAKGGQASHAGGRPKEQEKP